MSEAQMTSSFLLLLAGCLALAEPDTATPITDGFQMPVGPPSGKGYYDAQPFGTNHHLGADLNGKGGGNSDLGDPVTATAAGIVVMADDIGQGWGNIVLIRHKLPSGAVVESLYAHLDQIDVKVGQLMQRGQRLGTIGTASGRYIAHLHFEIRTLPGLGVGPGYSDQTDGWIDPITFIRQHPPKRLQTNTEPV